jgi:hypothetical protein
VERPKSVDARWRVSVGQPCQKVNLVQTTAAKRRAFDRIDRIDCISAHAEGFLKAVLGASPPVKGQLFTGRHAPFRFERRLTGQLALLGYHLPITRGCNFINAPI